MKVLHVIPSMSSARGGPAIALRQTISGLSARGVTVHVAATDDDGPNAHLPVQHGIGIADSGATCFYFPRQTRFYSFSWPLSAWLRSHIRDYDIVHIHALFSYPSTIAAILARRARVAYLLRPLGTLAQWGLSSRRPLLKRCSLALIERPLLRATAAVHATSEQERDEVLAACPQCKTIVVPNPVEIPAGPIVRPNRNMPQSILFLSRLDPKKGLEILLAAFDRLAAELPHLRLVVAGDGARSYTATLRAEERVTFTGTVDAAQKRLLFADADLFVLPSYSENFGIAVVEAMSQGVPVLISTNVGIHHEVTAAEAGRTAPCETIPLANAIREMLADPEELRRMGENGMRLAKERYAPEVVASQLESEYRKCLIH